MDWKWWLACAVLVIAAAFVLLRREARRLLRERRIRIDRFKLKSRHAAIEDQVFAAAEVREAIAEFARTEHVSTEDATQTARRYLQEILPKFNLLAYYRFGAPLAKLLLNFLYRVVVARKTLRTFGETAPKDAVVVYVINHRSNADYVLVAHMLFKFVSLSYAVGEWARVWPLNHLFKWFGAYFIRRRFREPLYHAVLAEFVRTITRNGVTQGFFIEGGLSRDGAFQKAKLGMLDYIVTSKRDPAFTAPLYLIPTAINYDRVLEDRVLTQELVGVNPDQRGRGEKLGETLGYLLRNLLRSVFGRFKRYGYAVVSFGEPIRVDDFIAAHPRIIDDDFDTRKPHIRALADAVMRSISDALPVTPVTLAARVFAEARHPLDDHEVTSRIEALLATMNRRAALLREHHPDEIWKMARRILRLRRLITLEDDGWTWAADERLLRDYYANALMSYDDVQRRGWPERPERRRSERAAATSA